MAKIAFSKLDLKVNNNSTSLIYTTIKEEEIVYEVKNYLPIKEKMDLVSRIINQSTDDNGFYNPMRVKLYTTLEVVYAYTNLTFTPKQKEDPFKLYDLLVSTGLYNNITSHICNEDLEELEGSIWDTIKSIYSYRNSVMGILENISSDYSGLSLEASEIQKKLAEGDGINFLQEVMAKMG